MADAPKPKADPIGDLKWFLGILLILGLVWFFNGGPSQVANNQLLTPGLDGSSSLDRNGNGVVDEQERIGGQLDQAQTEVDQIQKEIANATAQANASPYKGKVTLSMGNASATSPKDEYVQITAGSNRENISVSGWQLVSPITGNSATIPLGTSLPIVGQSQNNEPITLEPNARLIVTTGRSPIGSSFRLNMCTGYLGQLQTFSPYLPSACTLPSQESGVIREGQGRFSDQCLDYLDNVGQCTTPTNPPTGLGYACYDFIAQHLNYNACVSTHRGDVGFSRTEWRAFLGRDNELWKSRREVIKLLDQNGKVVDAITY